MKLKKPIYTILTLFALLITLFGNTRFTSTHAAGDSATVSTFADLMKAINNKSVDTIYLADNIQIEACYIAASDQYVQQAISRSLTITSVNDAGAPYTLYAPKEGSLRHFYISGTGTTKETQAHVVFENIILSGKDKDGKMNNSGGLTVRRGTVTFNNVIAEYNYQTKDVHKLGGSSVIYLYATETDAPTTKAVINSSIFRYNETYALGTGNADAGRGTISVQSNSELEINGSQFHDNYASHQGGAIYASGGTVSIKDTSFTNNTSVNQGGAIFIDTSKNAEVATLSITGGTFTNNKAQSGGAIALYAFDNLSRTTNVSIINTIFTKNSATGRVSDSGTVYGQGGAISVSNRESNTIKIDIDKSTFYENTAPRGGSIGLLTTNEQALGATLVSINDTNMYDNTAVVVNNGKTLAFDGGAIHTGIVNPNISFNITGSSNFYNNTSPNGDGGSIFTNNHDQVKVEASVNFYNNYAQAGYFISDEADINRHNSNVKTKAVTTPFTYSYNNYDINYTGDQLTHYTVNYLEFETNAILKPSVTKPGSVGETVYGESEIDSFTDYVYHSRTADIDLGSDVTENVITIYYVNKNTKVDYTIQYLDIETLESIKDSVVLSGTLGDIVDVDTFMQDIEDYFYHSDTGSITLSLDSSTNVITLYFEKEEVLVTPEPNQDEVVYTVHFIDGDTNVSLSESVTKSGTIGTIIDAMKEVIAINGYSYLKDTGNLTLQIDPVTNVITVYYVKTITGPTLPSTGVASQGYLAYGVIAAGVMLIAVSKISNRKED